MEKGSQQFEDLLRKSLEKSEISPSSQVLRKLKQRLWVADFFSLNPRKFNILYATFMLGGIISATLYTVSEDETSEKRSPGTKLQAKNSSSVPIEKVEVPEVGVSTPDLKATVSESPAPSAAFEVADARGCSPFQVEFVNRSSNARTFEWDFGTGEKSRETDPSYTYKTPGHYVAILKVSSGDGRIATYAQDIEVFKDPVADFGIDVNKSDGSGKKVQFINNSKGASSYSWSFGDGKTSSVKAPEHAYDSYRSYDVRLIARSENGCTDTAEIRNTFIEKEYRLVFDEYFRPYLHGKSGDGFYERARSDASIFGPRHNGVKDYQLTIWAPNGKVVFRTNTIRQGWNGYWGGRLAPQGTYTYEAVGVYPNGQPFKQAGRFNLIVEDIY
ncbi:MAG: PKD domain-containing protein [Bacteroidales bacterium]|nr:PKD domain-containing protein [Bacteroidales bacterium]